MALQIRRGTDAQRLTITPAEGELIYTTDTKLLYVGDGSTAGGTKADTGINDLLEDTTPQLGGNLDLNSQDITGVGNINNSGNITASGVVSAASGNFTNGTFGLATGNFKGTFAADDSVILIDGVSGKVNLAPNELNDIGNVAASSPSNGEVLVYNSSSGNWENGIASVSGDLKGSVFADDSKLMIDGVSGIAYGPFVGDLTGSVYADDSNLLIDGINNKFILAGNVEGDITTFEIDDYANLIFTRTSNSDISSSDLIYGGVTFGRDDSGPAVTTSQIYGGQQAIIMAADSTGAFATDKWATLKEGNLGLGTFNPSAKLDVQGSVIVTGNVKAASFTGTYTADDSSIIVDGIDKSSNFSTVTASSFVQVGGITTTERDNLTAANGMIIYNTSLNKFQGYENGAWTNLI